MKTILLLLLTIAVLATSAHSQISMDRFTGFLNNQPYKIYFWFDSLGGNPYDLSCPQHFRTIRMVPQTPGIGTDSTFLLRTNFQSREKLVYYYVPAAEDENCDLTIPGQTVRLLSSDKPFAPSRLDALQLQQQIDTATSDLVRYNSLVEKAKKNKLRLDDYLVSFVFVATSAALFAHTDVNGKVSGGSIALGSLVGAGGIYAFGRTMSKLGHYGDIKREIQQLELSFSTKF